MSLWQPVSPDIWQGRDDRHEASNALRLFSTTGTWPSVSASP